MSRKRPLGAVPALIASTTAAPLDFYPFASAAGGSDAAAEAALEARMDELEDRHGVAAVDYDYVRSYLGRASNDPLYDRLRRRLEHRAW